MPEPFDQTAKPSKTSALNEEIDYNLTSAYVAYETGQLDKAKTHLVRIKPEELSREGQIKFYHLYGDVEIDLGHEAEAIEFLNQALTLVEATPKPSPITQVRILNAIGGAYSHLNQNALAVDYHQRCRNIIEDKRLEDAILTFNVYFNLGREYFNLGENKRAEDYYLAAVKIAETHELTRQVAGVYWGLANIYKAQQEIEKAKTYFTRSSLIYERFNQLKDAVTVKSLLGGMLTDSGDYASAETILNSALQMAESLGDTKALWQTFGGLGHLYERQRRLDDAEFFIERGLKLAEQSGNYYYIAQSLANLADLKITKGDQAKGFELFQQAIEAAEKTDEVERASRISYRYATALEKAGLASEALKYYRKAYEYRV